MSMWCSSRVSQIDLPGAAAISAPCGQMAWPGSTLSFGTSEGADLPSSKRAADALVHAPRREVFGRAVERFDRLLDRAVVRPGERLLQLGDARADARALLRGEQSAVRRERRTRRFQQPLPLDARLGERARMHVLLRMREGVAQHALDVGIREAVGGLHRHRRFGAGGAFARIDGKEAIGVDLKSYPDARGARRHRRYALQLEARERAAVGDKLALALHDMEAHARLPILERGE